MRPGRRNWIGIGLVGEKEMQRGRIEEGNREVRGGRISRGEGDREGERDRIGEEVSLIFSIIPHTYYPAYIYSKFGTET